ncbi:MAG TPA: methyltransferase type 11 [Spirochaetaceae bacterium]|jgi:SAM-dependent methyltransferase|nr:methyltransferase type 11 [Spirochaetaceae bacterium]
MAADYIMESEAEYKRLELKTDVSIVEDYARRAGLSTGMRAVDLACGPGLTTSILASIVGNGGYALGLDASAKRIDRARKLYANATTAFDTRDFLKPIEGVGAFDFAWMRFALEYYRAESFDIVRNAAGLLSAGGILCLVDLDYNCLNHYGMSPRLEAAFNSVMAQLESKANFDPYAGRKLYSHLYRLGFEDIKVAAGAHHLIYGELKQVDEYNWEKKIETLSKNLPIELPGYASVDEFHEDFMAFFRNPGRFTYTPILAAWGRKPA